MTPEARGKSSTKVSSHCDNYQRNYLITSSRGFLLRSTVRKLDLKVLMMLDQMLAQVVVQKYYYDFLRGNPELLEETN